MATVLHFEINPGARRFRFVIAQDISTLERFDGRDALGVERWRDANLHGSDGRVDAELFDAIVDSVARAALAHAGRLLAHAGKAGGQ